MVCGQNLRSSAALRACMAGLLVCSNFGPPLRADEGPLVITASGEQRSAPTASGDHTPGVRFHESDSDSTVSRSRKSSLKLGNQPSVPERDGETQITGPTSGSSGFRFADGEGPRQVAPSGHNLAGTSPDTSKSTAPQFRFDDQRPRLLRQRRGAAGWSRWLCPTRPDPLSSRRSPAMC
jgi:hypothetical protein